MPLLLAISGYHNAGKTTLALSISKILRERGFKIAIVKSSKDKEILTDIPEKDTWIYREAGIPLVGLLQKNIFTLYLNPENLNLSSLKDWYVYFLSLFWNFNLVILEGFKSFDMIHKIWVVKEEDEDLKKIKSEVRNLLGFVIKDDIERWKALYPEERFFLFKEEKLIANFIEGLIKKYEPRVLLKVNNQKIPMKDFVEEILISPLLGFIKVLKGVPEKIENVEIKIKFNKELDKENI